SDCHRGFTSASSRAQSDSQASPHAAGEGSVADLFFFSTPQRQRNMNERDEADSNRCIGVLCRWVGGRSIVVTTSQDSCHNLESGMVSKRISTRSVAGKTGAT